MSRPNDWLLDHARDVTSSAGEDGVIETVLETLPENDRWCVEFGAYDGRYLSNTHDLITRKGYSAVLIEPDPRRFQQLVARFADNPRVTAKRAIVGTSSRDGLDALLDDTGIPVDFDLLSIDIDGNDYHVWRAVKQYTPKVVVIEINPTIPAHVSFVQPSDPRVHQGSSLKAIAELGRAKGYGLVAATLHNAILVRDPYLGLFEIEDNSPAALRKDAKVTYVFQGFDGTLFLAGNTQLLWHRIPISEHRIQQLPRFMRSFPDDYGPIRRLVFAVLYRLRWRRHLRRTATTSNR